IIPSLICSDIFLNNIDTAAGFDFKGYRDQVLKRFGYYDDVYRIVRLKMAGKLSTVKHFGLLMNMYINMNK
ncbi:MAG: hypothetical protein WCE25_13100, partial [Nitrososphaeraceae archaeon]